MRQSQRRGTFGLLRSGKRHARINEWDLGRIIIPLPCLNVQAGVAQKLEQMEKELDVQRRQLMELRDKMDREIFRSVGLEIAGENR